MKPPFFSIIIATFNAGQTLDRAIQSIRGQSWKDFELIIADGGSEDHTISILKDISESDSRVRYFSESDKGVYDALNKGISFAKGEWIYFLGADDYLCDDNVLFQINYSLASSSASVVYGNVWYESYKRLYDGEFPISKLLTRNVCHQAVFYKSNLFNDIGIYNINYKTEADYDFNLRCWLMGVKTQFVPVLIAFYSAGGKSESVRDALLVQDYPFTASSYLLTGKLPRATVIRNLANVFRKTLLRYSPGKLSAVVRRNGDYPEKVMAFFWMLLTLPFYFLASIFPGKE